MFIIKNAENRLFLILKQSSADEKLQNFVNCWVVVMKKSSKFEDSCVPGSI